MREEYSLASSLLGIFRGSLESVPDKSSYVVGHVMVLYSPDWTNIGFSFILLTVNQFRHPTLIQHGLHMQNKTQ